MAEFARQSIVHGVVAALVVAALAGAWRVTGPRLRARLDLVALAGPVLVLPFWLLVAPGRTVEPFADEGTLFWSLRWNDLELGGIGLADLAVLVFATVGVGLLARDVVPLLADRFESAWTPLPEDDPCWQRAREALDTATVRMRIAAPRLAIVDDEAPVAFCTGLVRPVVVVSKGTCQQLDAAELGGAVAHELAHVESRDPLVGWLLMAVRAVMFFNPAVHLVARDLVQQLERQADDRAASVTGDRLALASGLLKTFAGGPGAPRAGRGWPVPGFDTPGRLLQEYRAAALGARCRRLLGAPDPPEPWHDRLRLALAASAVPAVLFFVI